MGLSILRDDTDKLAERLAELKKLSVYVGYQGADGAAIHPDSEISVAKLAAVLEWGSDERGVGQHSFIRSTMLEHRADIGTQLKHAVAACIQGKTTPVQAYERVGKYVVGLIRDRLGREVNEVTHTLAKNLSYAVRRRRTVVAEGK